MVYPVSPCHCLPDLSISVRLGREPFPAVRPADGPSRALYPPYLLLERPTPGDFESAPFDVTEVGGGDGAPDVDHVQLRPALLREIDRRPSGGGVLLRRVARKVARKQYLLRETAHFPIRF